MTGTTSLHETLTFIKTYNRVCKAYYILLHERFMLAALFSRCKLAGYTSAQELAVQLFLLHVLSVRKFLQGNSTEYHALEARFLKCIYFCSKMNDPKTFMQAIDSIGAPCTFELLKLMQPFLQNRAEGAFLELLPPL